MCGTAQRGGQFTRVLCREDHSWRAISVVDLTEQGEQGVDQGNDKIFVAGRAGGYPGENAVRNAGEDACADAARAIAADALDYEWGYEWPTKEQWRSRPDLRPVLGARPA